MKWTGVAAGLGLLLALAHAASAATYSGGSGAAENPYQIGSAADWVTLSNTEADWDKHFILIADIDFEGASLNPVGSSYMRFSGNFDGGGHVLRNAVIDRADDPSVGLFRVLGAPGIITHLEVQDMAVYGRAIVGVLVGYNLRGSVISCNASGSVTATEDHAGGLVGYNAGGTVVLCHATGSVSATGDYVGGLMGQNLGTVELCYTTAAVSGRSYVGGMMGTNSGVVEACHASGAVLGYGIYAGGLIGRNLGGTVEACHATGMVSGGSSVGALIGDINSGSVISCYATGTGTGGNSVGSLIGAVYYGGSVISCYATGAASGNRGIGGLIGRNYGAVTSCYATGMVSGSVYSGGLLGENSGTVTSCFAMGVVTGTKDAGGLIGLSSGTAIWSFWDVDASGQTASAGGEGLTTSQMQTVSPFQNAGWGAYGWVMESGDYPRLAWENLGWPAIPGPEPVPLAGSGTEGDPYLVTSATEFAFLSTNVRILDSHIRLTANLDMSGQEVYPIGGAGFTGVFDGAGYVISNVAINLPEIQDVGIFSRLGTGGVIQNFGIENVMVSGKGSVGGLVGRNNGGTVTACHVTGTIMGAGNNVGGLLGVDYNGSVVSCHARGAVSGDGQIGGLVGYAFHTSIISACSATGAVSGKTSVGGLLGHNFGTVQSCFATGEVSGTRHDTGGLVGHNSGTVQSCYATGEVSGTSYDTGGLVGRNLGTVESSYATGAVAGGTYVGGLIGENSGPVIWSYWDVDTTGLASSAGGRGLTTSEMHTVSYFQNAGWGTYGWAMEPGNYPRLVWEDLGWPTIPEPEPVPLAGSGTEADPYLVTSTTEFAFLSTHALILDSHIRLTANLDLADQNIYPIAEATFAGVFDGGGHVISNLVMNFPDATRVGIFSRLGAGGVIRNLGLEDVVVAGKYHVGGLVSHNDGGTVSGCYVTGTVSGSSYVGGLVGLNNGGTVESCHAAATVRGSDATGGLIGENQGGTVSECYATGTVRGTGFRVGGLIGGNSGTVASCHATSHVRGESFVGGLVGRNMEGTVSECHATGYIEGSYDAGGLVGYNEGGTVEFSYATGYVGAEGSAGGLVGANSGIVQSCHATGSVEGYSYDCNDFGGLVGWNSATVLLCYATGSASGSSYVGGLMGYNSGTVESCYATGFASGYVKVGGLIGGNEKGTVTACYSAGAISKYSSFGGLVGVSDSGPMTACYWDVDTSGVTVSAGGEGRTTADMTYPYALNAFVGWDFLEVWAADVDHSVNKGYPYLRFNSPPAEGDPCRGPIHSADQDGGNRFGLGELLRVIQLFNSGGYECATPPESTEDGYQPAASPGDFRCCPHDSDYAPPGPDWRIELIELLRLIQFFNSGGYHHCPGEGTEDGYCPG